MSVYCATAAAIVFAGVSLLVCIISLGSIYDDVSYVWSELDNEISTFKVITDDIWKDMIYLGAGTPANRQRRQNFNGNKLREPNLVQESPYGFPIPAQRPPVAERCQCSSTNSCPPGPPGPSGPKGIKGTDGIPGRDGNDAPDAIAVQNEPPTGCFVCPPGPRGLPGPTGAPGLRGMRGPPGTPGFHGRNSMPGAPGEMGPPGLPGDDGEPGKPGQNGDDALKPYGQKGPPGPKGAPGPEGPPGDKGLDAPRGQRGTTGRIGTSGAQGAAGMDGETGAPGLPGRPGDDAAYCPCPPRNENSVERVSPPK